MAKLVTVEFVAENTATATGTFQVGGKRVPLLQSLETLFWKKFKGCSNSVVLAHLRLEGREQLWKRNPCETTVLDVWTRMA